MSIFSTLEFGTYSSNINRLYAFTQTFAMEQTIEHGGERLYVLQRYIEVANC